MFPPPKTFQEPAISDKFSLLEKNVRIFMDNASFLAVDKPKKESLEPEKNLETMILLLKGIRNECEGIKSSQSLGFIRDYQEKLARLEKEVSGFEAKKKRCFIQESFQIFHSEGVIKGRPNGEARKPKSGNKENQNKGKKATGETSRSKKTMSGGFNGNGNHNRVGTR